MCTSCGHEEGRWLGRCPGCGEWNSLKEMKVQEDSEGGNPVLALGKSARKTTGTVSGARNRPIETAETQLQDLSKVIPDAQSRFVAGLGGLFKRSS